MNKEVPYPSDNKESVEIETESNIRMEEEEKNEPGIPISNVPQVLQTYFKQMDSLRNVLRRDPKENKLTKARIILNDCLDYISGQIQETYIPVLKMDAMPNSDSLNIILSRVLSRISSLMAKFLNNQESPLILVHIFFSYEVLILWAKELEEPLLSQSYLLNVTRSINDEHTDPFSAKIKEYLTRYPTTVTTLTQEEVSLEQKAQSLFASEIVNSKLFRTSVAKLAKQYQLEDSFKEMIDSFKSICIVWVKEAKFWGMVGFNQTIFLNHDIFTSPLFKTEKQRVSKIIQCLIHEGMNLAFRKAKNNFLEVTPCKADPNKPLDINALEGGYRLEEFIWGRHNIAFYHPNYVDRVISPNCWNSENSLFSDIIESGEKIHYREISNAYCSGLELMEEDILSEM